jgi:elongation factor Tu
MSANFLINDVFSIAGRGTVATGTVKGGEVSVDMTGRIRELKTRIVAIEMFRKNLATAKEGDNCGLILEGIRKEDIKKGDVIIFD